MTVDKSSAKQGAAPEKFRAHGTQSEWLNKAKDRMIRVRLTHGEEIIGKLTSHDIYCIAIQPSSEVDSRIIYKDSISYIILV
jgi:sRNA-binding regulator protein Hfq